MSTLERLSQSIARRVSAELKLDEEREEVIAYGAFGILHTALSVIAVLVAALVFKLLLEAVLILSTIMMLRKYTGGAHASSPTGCSLMSGIFVISLALLTRFFQHYANPWNLIAVIFLGFTASFIAIYRRAPVDSPNKPISEKHALSLRKGAFAFFAVCFAFAVFSAYCYFRYGKAVYYTISISLTSGFLWQSFTLTKPGQAIIKTIDTFLKKIFF